MSAIVLSLPENERIAGRIGAHLDLDVSSVAVHRFPDGEARVRVKRSLTGKAVVLVATLDRADQKSAQWVESVAGLTQAPHAVLSKRRSGDETVALMLPDLRACLGHQPVLLDDIIASGATMIEATKLLRSAGWPAPICLAVHPVFAGNAYASLQAAGAGKIASCDTITHPSNQIEVSKVLAAAVEHSLAVPG